MQYELNQAENFIENIEYGEDVKIKLIAVNRRVSEVIKLVADITSSPQNARLDKNLYCAAIDGKFTIFDDA